MIPAGLLHLIENVRPAQTKTSCLRIANLESELFELERCYIQNAVAKRKNEFATGRACAREALSYLGIPSCTVLRGTRGEPIWPAEVAGSITHDGDYCIASVARRSHVPFLGIDLASTEPLGHELVRLICTFDEAQQILERGVASFSADPFKLVFSIKEAVYKCLFPIVKVVFDFQDVALRIDPVLQVAHVELLNAELFAAVNVDIRAKYGVWQDYVFAAVWVPT